jgi:hypothetical protein
VAVHRITTHSAPFGYYARCADCGAITAEYHETAESAYYALCASIRAFAYGPVQFA